MGISRRPHALTPNKTTAKPSLHIFADVESSLGPYEGDWRKHTFRLGQALFWRRRTDGKPDRLEWYRIESIDQFWTWVEAHTRSGTKLVFVTHNLNYDLSMLKAFQTLPKRSWELTKFYSEQGCKIFVFRKGKRTIQFVDNGNWFKGTLASWGDRLGYPKLAVDFDDVTDDDLATYCQRDVDILYRLWVEWYQFLQDHNAGAWGITVPSQAFNCYRHRFMFHPIFIHNEEAVLNLERESYHGGRTEVFRTGTFTGDRFYKVDVNSMYPHVMKQAEYPTSLRGHSQSMNLRGLRYRLDRYDVIARVRIRTDAPYFPLKYRSKLCYPIGEFETVLTTPEIELALDRDWLLEIGETAWYAKAPIFSEYVDYWYKQKVDFESTGDHRRYHLIKLFLNSLYGKFGQQSSTMIEIGECDPDEFNVVHYFDSGTETWRTEYYIGGKVFLTERTGNSYHAFPAIAAHVTAHARLYLYQLVEAVDRSNVYYCDTDSLIIGTTGFERLTPLIDPHRLGFLKIETIGDHLTIFAPKDYVLGDEVRIKGVRSDAEWLNDNTVRQEHFPSIRGLMDHGFDDGYRSKRVTKHLTRKVLTGDRDDQGVVSPFVIYPNLLESITTGQNAMIESG